MTTRSKSEIDKEMTLFALQQGKHVIISSSNDNRNKYIITPYYFNIDNESPFGGYNVSNNLTGIYIACRLSNKQDVRETVYEINWNFQFDFAKWTDDFEFNGLYNPSFDQVAARVDDWVVTGDALNDRFSLYNICDVRADNVIGEYLMEDRFSYKSHLIPAELMVLTNDYARSISDIVKERQTVTIDGITYDKQAIKNRIKELKPVE